MREYLEKATHKIACGFDPDVVIDALLLEKSIYSPTSHVRIPFVGRKKIPGGSIGLGAAAGAALKGYMANKRAKAKGIKGKEKLKHIAKAAAKGAIVGGVGGYATQLGQRVARASAAKEVHAARRSRSYWTTVKGDPKGENKDKVFSRSADHAKKQRIKGRRQLKQHKAHKGMGLSTIATGGIERFLGSL